jgi:hypothetical protein
MGLFARTVHMKGRWKKERLWVSAHSLLVYGVMIRSRQGQKGLCTGPLLPASHSISSGDTALL